jgi:hypothetical protein
MLRQKALVPAYIYPSWSGSDWDKLIAAGDRVWAIMNPNSGPGTSSNSDYVAPRPAGRLQGLIL